MSAAPYRVERLGSHDRRAFSSGSAALDRYFREQVGQDVRRRIASCFVAVDAEAEVAGYYTLAATSLLLDALAPERRSKLPRYTLVPGVLLGRLAVALSHQGRRLAGALVADALLRASASDIMAHVMVVDAKDEPAARFYQHLEFTRLASDPSRLIRVL